MPEDTAADIEVLERGDIQFFFRPTVQPADALETELGVQSFFVVLSPAGGRQHRRVRIGKKRMPAPRGERFWGRVERVGSLDRVLGGQLEDETYTTKTRGERYQPAARPIAYGCYAFVRHADHTHFVYRVDGSEPDAPDEVRPPDSASNVILFERTPRTKATWTTSGAPDMLDHEGEELVLVGVDDELGIDVLEADPQVGQTQSR